MSHWDLRCNECRDDYFLDYNLENRHLLVEYVKLFRDIKTNNAMPKYMLQHLINYRILLDDTLYVVNRKSGVEIHIGNWLEKHWKHSISVVNKYSHLLYIPNTCEIEIPRKFTDDDLKELGL